MIKSTLVDAREIVVYIYNHGRILNLMRKLTKNKELHRACVTRFATQFYTIKSIHENRHRIQVLFVSQEWRKSDFSKKPGGKKVEQIVAKTEFWDNIHLAYRVLAPLVDVKNVNDERLVTKILGMIQTRWSDQMYHPLHAAGYYLNPAIFHGEKSKDIKNNGDILTGLYVAIDRLVPDEDENDKVRLDLNSCIDSIGQFGSSADIWLEQKLHHLHTKKRNCLTQKKLSDLVYVQYNTKLQRRFNSLQSNKSLDPILLRDVDENDDWVIPTEEELQEFVDGGDGLRWSNAREPTGGNEEVGASLTFG
ncbi:uncharacterized protein LOC143610994 [Bidens hawaiensis]|uniref:uncharacterized protein LOC143610994 n=1 Tax=Bidens hawaiensis TaxID=980011 RepID=UPI004048EE83